MNDWIAVCDVALLCLLLAVGLLVLPRLLGGRSLTGFTARIPRPHGEQQSVGRPSHRLNTS